MRTWAGGAWLGSGQGRPAAHPRVRGKGVLALPWPSPGNCQHPTWLLQVQPLDQGQGPQQPSATHDVPALERTLMHRFGPRKVFSIRAEFGDNPLSSSCF